jgi:hypothetical protein
MWMATTALTSQALPWPPDAHPTYWREVAIERERHEIAGRLDEAHRRDLPRDH